MGKFNLNSTDKFVSSKVVSITLLISKKRSLV